MPRVKYEENNPHKDRESEREKRRKAILERQEQRQFSTRLAKAMSSDDKETVAVSQEEVSAANVGNVMHYRFDASNLMRWEEKYPAFSDILNSGKYVFYKGYICLLSRDCFSIQDGKISFQEDFVRAHLSKYCVAANYTSKYRVLHHAKYGTIYLKTTELDGFSRAKKESSTDDALYKEILSSDLSIIFIGGGGGDPFSDLLNKMMDGPPKVTQIELHERTGISIRTLSRMMNESNSSGPGVATRGSYGLNEIIACAVALHMNPIYSLKLVHLGGYELRDHVPLDRAYHIILCQYYSYSVAACNNYLEKHGLKPLTDNDKITSYR